MTRDKHDVDDAIQAGRHSYPLPGYTRRALPHAEVVAASPLIESFVSVLEQHGTLYSWARHQEQPRALRGRAPVYVATFDASSGTSAVVRHSWHGGLLAPFTGDRYLRPTRAPLELLRSFMLRECEIPTPEVLGFALYPAGPMMARVDVATRFVENAYDLAAVLGDFAADISRTAAFVAVHTLLVQLASFGFTHPDLNVKNILLYRDAGTLVAAVLDVDVVQWNAKQKPADVMLANVARLARSLRKSRAQFGVNLPDAELNDLVAGMLAAAPVASQARSRAAPAFTAIDRL